MNNILLTFALLAVFYTSTVSATKCTDDVTTCSNAFKTATAMATGNVTVKCDALILEYTCLRATEKACTVAEVTDITTLNKQILKLIEEDCAAQLCTTELVGCYSVYQSNQTVDKTSIPKTCRDAAQFEACLTGITTTCTKPQQAQIKSVLITMRAQTNKVCKHEDCSVQLKACQGSFNQVLAVSAGNQQITCMATEGLAACLRGIEVDCTAKQTKELNTALKQVKSTIDTKCAGVACTPNIIECSQTWNVSATGVTDMGKLCTSDKTFESCLKAGLKLCSADEAVQVKATLAQIAPAITTHCGANGADNGKPMTLLTLLVTSIFVLRSFV